MKKIIVMLLVCSSVTVFAQKTDFSGNWTINKDKTDFGEAPEYVVPKSIKVVQGENKTTVSKILLDLQLKDQPAVTDILQFDGKSVERKSDNGLIILSLKWPDDHSFIIHAKTPDDVIDDTWTLENGGKTLVMNRVVVENNGAAYNVKAFYDKQ